MLSLMPCLKLVGKRGNMRLTAKEFKGLVEQSREADGSVLKQLEGFLAEVDCGKNKHVGSPFNSDEWELVKTYEFNKRTSYIYRNTVTGEERAWDKLKKGED